jgi:hypothetical protein
MLAMLRAIDDRDEEGDLLDSSTLARRLGWTDATTTSSLGDAKAHLLIWGIRVGPGFEDLELTVQGRRLLKAAGGADD